MAGAKGHRAIKLLRARPKDKRGGNEPHEEDFVREPQSLAVRVDAYLDHMRMLNRTEAAVLSQWHALKYFMRWAHERDLTHPEQITYCVIERYQRWLWRYRKLNGKPLSVSSIGKQVS